MPQTVKRYILENIDKTVRHNPVGEGTLIGLPRPYNVPSIAKIAVEKSKTSVLLMDRSKIGTVCTYDICRSEQLTDVILF